MGKNLDLRNVATPGATYRTKKSGRRIQLEVGAEARLCDSDRSRMVETLGSIYDSTAAVPHHHDNQKNLVTLQND